MAVKTQWANVGIFGLLLLGVVLLVYTYTNKTSTSVLTDDQEVNTLLKNKVSRTKDEEKPCCRRDERNLGRLKAIAQPPKSLTELQEQIPFVKLGGRWDPASCKAPIRVAIIVAYRNRLESLLVFLNNLHPMLQKQHLDYQMFIVEQSELYSFNKGKLQNIGFKEAQKYGEFECFVFHDVDMIPEDERNYYGCPTSPRHLSPSLDKHGNDVYSPDAFGGAVAFLMEDFVAMNGYSNSFYGVEGENEDMLDRIHRHHKQVTRPVLEIGRYAMVQHSSRLHPKEQGHEEQRVKPLTEERDGLNTLRYKVLHSDRYDLFTLIKVDLLWNKNEKEAF